MLSRNYHTACAAFSYVPADQHGQLSCVLIGGQWLYRKTLTPKCKRCRAIAGRFTLMAPSKGDSCGSCGNPFIYRERIRQGARVPVLVKAC